MYNSQNLPLSPLKIIKKTLSRTISIMFPFVIIFVVLYLEFHFIPGIMSIKILNQIKIALLLFAPIILLVVVILSFIYEYFYYKCYYYDFREEDADIRKGVISRATGNVRYEKLQNIYVSQDFLDRIFGLYDVHYETAGNISGFYLHVDGLNKTDSEKLVEFLKQKTTLL